MKTRTVVAALFVAVACLAVAARYGVVDVLQRGQPSPTPAPPPHLTKELLLRTVLERQGLRLELQDFDYDGRTRIRLTNVRLLGADDDQSVAEMERVTLTVAPERLGQGLLSAHDIEATSGTIYMKRLDRLTTVLIDRQRRGSAELQQISWIFDAPGGFVPVPRTVRFKDLKVRDASKKVVLFSVPYTIDGLTGEVRTRGTDAVVEHVTGFLKAKPPDLLGVSLGSDGGPLGKFTKGFQTTFKGKALNLSRLGDPAARGNMEPELFKALTFLGYLMGGRPTATTTSP